jgi:hypothetical protein
MVDANPMLRVVPHFLEVTGHGAKDMTQIMIVLVELKFDGIIILDRAQPSKMGMVRTSLRLCA